MKKEQMLKQNKTQETSGLDVAGCWSITELRPQFQHMGAGRIPESLIRMALETWVNICPLENFRNQSQLFQIGNHKKKKVVLVAHCFNVMLRALKH